MFWCKFGRRTLLHLIRPRHCSNATGTTSTSEVKKLYIRNVFKDNPSAKYYLLTSVAVTAGTTYYVYNNQQKKKFILNVLPQVPNHYIVQQNNEIAELKSLLEQGGVGRLHEVQISGPTGSGKTQIARLLAESLNATRKESVQFKIWPKDEVTATLHAHSKESLLASLKQLASKLGCEKDEIKLENHDLEQQLDLFSQAVKGKLKLKPSWILVIDNHDKSIPLSKWLPDSDWGNGYVIYTINSKTVCNSENENQHSNFSAKQMISDLAKQIISGITSTTTDDSESHKEPPECLLNLLQYNPLSLACAAIYFKCKAQQNESYTYEDLYTDIDQTVKQLQAVDPDANKLQIIQVSSATLATKALGECSPELLHVFDFLGSCSVNDPIPMFLFSHHLKTSEYHVQMKPEERAEQGVLSEDTSLSVNAAFEQEHDLWSFRGIVDRGIKI